LQPKVKELQAKYANDAERLQVETARLYQNAGVNPLAGCLPTLATIPVFIGLYRALSNVADEGLLTEGFFWIPSLAGPTKLNGGLGWLTLQDGAPPLGWHDTAAYLVLPVLLVISQYVSTKIISPPSNANDPSQQQTQAILKFIPLMIGWFSLSVPAGLTLYWFTNNIITTAQQVYLRNKFKVTTETAGTGVIDVTGTYVKPKEEVEVRSGPSGKELGARRSSNLKAAEAIIDLTPDGARESAQSRGEKFRAIKAREAAKRAAEQAGTSSTAPQQAASDVVEASATLAVADEEKLEVPNAPPSKDGSPSNGSRGKSSGKKGKKK
jgi:YidC/Oxa1 family membrane protein insertase